MGIIWATITYQCYLFTFDTLRQQPIWDQLMKDNNQTGLGAKSSTYYGKRSRCQIRITYRHTEKIKSNLSRHVGMGATLIALMSNEYRISWNNVWQDYIYVWTHGHTPQWPHEQGNCLASKSCISCIHVDRSASYMMFTFHNNMHSL